MKLSTEMTLATGHMMSIVQISMEMAGLDEKGNVDLTMALDPEHSEWWIGVRDALVMLVTDATGAHTEAARPALVEKLQDFLLEERLQEFEG